MFKAEAVSPCGFRADGRLVYECRQLRCRTSVPSAAASDLTTSAEVPDGPAIATAGASGSLASCDGRAVVSLGCTKVMALVYGPQPSSNMSTLSTSSSNTWSVSCTDNTSAAMQMMHEGKQGLARGELAVPVSVVCSVGLVDSCVRTRSRYTPDAAEIAAAVRTAAEGIILRRLYTQTRITISILVLADDGSILSASLIAASLALADAGVAMRDLLPSCTVLLLPQQFPQQQQEPLLLVDPTSDETRSGGPCLTLGVTAETNNVGLFAALDFLASATTQLVFRGCQPCSV
ncbi:exosome complex exonuclease, putative [Eimeria tenella]|uniref:Exosome complex exonuclease, putative n=1 Tax=Eimeria tenella TaxID=5802 RepID=U6KVZ2_EIMTE|nr:exosome complex exonuclease, putative [Eimeria tenella]CDJ41093.1 exosome complex exonuclease, putative [Eimeria tenella]|eukprot:XP_013231843.1 exosome complex exonuclease, putative [Eimeria tenella]